MCITSLAHNVGYLPFIFTIVTNYLIKTVSDKLITFNVFISAKNGNSGIGHSIHQGGPV